MRRLALSLILLGCTKGPAVLGEEARLEVLEESAKAVDETLRAGTQGKVTLRGRIGQVCDEGCWFYLLGEAGVLYVKLNLVDGLTVSPESTGKEAIVRGRLQSAGGAHTLLGETVVLY